MPSRSGKSFSSTASRLALLVSFALAPSAIAAELTVRSISHGSTVGSIAYYATTGNLDSGEKVVAGGAYEFEAISPTINQASDVNFDKMLRFEVRYDTDLTSNVLQSEEFFAIAIDVTGPGGKVAGAIAAREGRACTAGTVNNCFYGKYDITNGTLAGETRRFAVLYENLQTVELGIYPQDLCQSYRKQTNQVATGCSFDGTTDSMLVNSGTTVNAMTLTFRLVILGRKASLAEGGTEEKSEVASESFVIRAQSDPPLLSCGARSNSQVYFPGDEEIFLETGYFGITTEVLSPATTVLALIKQGSGAGSNPILTVNDRIVRVPRGITQSVGGFTNSAQGAEIPYRVALLARNAAGQITADTSPTCAITDDVKTASIRGFLEKGQCFIATAAFNSFSEQPLPLLRDFRDDVLMSFSAGQGFVRWYYSWSPDAAEWLMRNPGFREPVLFLLAPLQVVAWLMLHPTVFLSLLMGSALFGIALRRRLA